MVIKYPTSMDALRKLALKLGTEGPYKHLSTDRKVQVIFGGTYIISTTNALYIWEHAHYPHYYFRLDELTASAQTHNFTLQKLDPIITETGTTVADRYSLTAGGKTTESIIAWRDSPSLSGSASILRGLVKIDFAAPDHWLEEDTPIYVHPKDPFKRIDILQSRRPIQVSVDGHVIAKSEFAFHLHETSLICRYYIPITAYDASVLRPSKTRSQCPYKGEAEYYSVEVGGKVYEDLVWYYRTPTYESGPIVNLLCPYNEKVDIELDGVKLERPTSAFVKTKPGEASL